MQKNKVLASLPSKRGIARIARVAARSDSIFQLSNLERAVVAEALYVKHRRVTLSQLCSQSSSVATARIDHKTNLAGGFRAYVLQLIAGPPNSGLGQRGGQASFVG
jgi:hypothetical protein